MTQPATEPAKVLPIKPKSNRIAGYVVNIILNALFLYIVNNLLRWEAQFITQRWSEVLGIINIQIIASLAAYVTFIVYDRRLYYFMAKTLLDALSIIVSYRLIVVFPFDFYGFYHQTWLNGVFPYLLWLGIAGLLIALIVRAANLVRGKNIYL